jgi:SAM-dependent methyltransferase
MPSRPPHEVESPLPNPTTIQICRMVLKGLQPDRPLDALETGSIVAHEDLDIAAAMPPIDHRLYRTNIDGDVDFHWDLEQPLPDTAPARQFDLIFCLSVMEHVRRPWIACANLEAALKPGGILLWSTPWVHRVHGYPDDYWRFSPSAIRSLLPAIQIESLWQAVESDRGHMLIDARGDLFEQRLVLNEARSASQARHIGFTFDQTKASAPRYAAQRNLYAEFLGQPRRTLWMPYSAFFMVGRKAPSAST